MRVYFDASALAKRYVRESGTDAVLDWCERADELALAVIAVPDLISAFCRLRREGAIDEAEYRGLKNDLMTDISDALLCDTTPEVIRDAVDALEKHTEKWRESRPHRSVGDTTTKRGNLSCQCAEYPASLRLDIPQMGKNFDFS